MKLRTATIAGVLGILVLAAVAGLVILQSMTSAPSLEKKMNAALQESTQGLYRADFGSTSLDWGSRTFTLDRFRIAPDSLELARLKEAGESPAIEFSFEAESIRCSGIDLNALLRGRIDAASATVESPVSRAFLNRQSPKKKATTHPKRMPHELLTQLPRSVRIDTIVVKNGTMVYSELARDGARPGTISFEAVNAAVYGLISDPQPGFEAPCRIDLRMLLAGEGDTEITLVYDLTSPRLDLSYQGRVGRMPATAFSEILENLEGVRVKTGTHDSTWFSFVVKGDVADGKVQVLYHGLDSEMIRKGTHEQGLSENLATFIGNRFKINDANPADDKKPALVVPVHHERPGPENFFRFLWVIVRQGLYVTMGIQ